MQRNSPRFSEIHHWIIITEPFPLQFKHEFTTESGELKRDHRGKSEKEKEKFQRIWTGEEEEEKSPIYFRNSSQESTKQNQTQEFLKIPVRISE